MKRVLLFLSILLPGLLMAQKNIRHNHPDSSLAKRMQPKDCTLAKLLSLAHGKKMETIAVYNDTVSFQAYVYLFPGGDTSIIVDTLGPGLFDYPIVISVYYANADKDAEKELFIQYSLGVRRPNGNKYDYVHQNMTGIYDEMMSGDRLVGVKKSTTPED